MAHDVSRGTSGTPAVYVEATRSGAGAETVVKVVWNPACIEELSFGSLTEALAFAQSVCETPEDDDSIIVV